MSEAFNTLPEGTRWKTMVQAAVSGATSQGYKCSRVPGKGLANLWRLEKGGKVRVASIRTTRDRWFTFLPLEGGNSWKTLDEADVVLVASVDDKDHPTAVEVYLFEADEVRERFNEAHAARVEAGHVVKDDFGFWVNLDLDHRPTATAVGSGLAAKHDPIAVYPLADLVSAPKFDGTSKPATVSPSTEESGSEVGQPASIAEVMAWAREHIARLAGVRPEAVKLDLKLEY
jgi:hypothetical protein